MDPWGHLVAEFVTIFKWLNLHLIRQLILRIWFLGPLCFWQCFQNWVEISFLRTLNWKWNMKEKFIYLNVPLPFNFPPKSSQCIKAKSHACLVVPDYLDCSYWQRSWWGGQRGFWGFPPPQSKTPLQTSQGHLCVSTTWGGEKSRSRSNSNMWCLEGFVTTKGIKNQNSSNSAI